MVQLNSLNHIDNVGDVKAITRNSHRNINQCDESDSDDNHMNDEDLF